MQLFVFGQIGYSRLNPQ